MPSGGKGGSGGSVSVPKINPFKYDIGNVQGSGPQNMATEMQGLENLSSYASGLLNTPLSLGNWAANIATGGMAVPAYGPTQGQLPFQGDPYFGSIYAIPPSPGIGTPGLTTSQSPFPTGGPGGAAPSGAAPSGMMMDKGAVGIPASTGGTPSGAAAPGQGGLTWLPGVMIDANGNTVSQIPNAPANVKQGVYYNPATGQALDANMRPISLRTGAAQNQLRDIYNQKYPAQQPAAAQPAWTPPSGPAPGTGTPSGWTAFNPLETEWQNILAAQDATKQIPGIQAATDAINQRIQGSEQFLERAVQSPTGLTPQQEAYVKQATESGQAAIRSQLGAEGLTSSTQSAMLQDEISQAGAATAGQLQQGNIQLMQAAQKLALGGQELSLGEEGMLFSQLSSIASQAGGVQSTLYSEAMQGYGLLGQFMNQILAPMGMQMQGWTDFLNAEAAQASNQTQLEIAQLQAQQSQGQMMGGLFQGLGSLFGSGAGGSGGILGGLGGLLGGAGGAAGVLGSAGGASIGAGEAATAALGAVGGLAAF